MNVSSLLTRVDQIIEAGKVALASEARDGYHQHLVDSAKAAHFQTAAMSFIERTFGKDHSHYAQFKKNSGLTHDHAAAGVAVMEAIRAEIAGGWLITLKGLVAAEVFADFISMAEHLLEAGYKDPAAVMAGSVLEEHLRQLCGKHGVPITEEKHGEQVPLKADRLNADLHKAGVYTLVDQKLVTAWLGVRNNAAHGKYDLYTKDHVEQLTQGVLGFLARVPL